VLLPGPTILTGAAGKGGYRRLVAAPVEPHTVRNELGGPAPSGRWRGVVAFAQVSDLHITDAQSPARAEYLDRLGDDDSGVAHLVGPVGTYRAQEALTYHVVEAMTARLRRIDTGPVTGVPVTFAVSTGDAADNAQVNEIEASIRLLDGGAEIRPDSGTADRWEGVGAAAAYDPRYWHPDGTPAGEQPDRPRERFGFPTIPGLLDAARLPFGAQGLGLPWHPVYGNHDGLLAGTVPATPGLRRISRGARKATGWPSGVGAADLQRLFGDSRRRPPELLRPLSAGPWRRVSPDIGREPLSRAAWVHRHQGRSARPGSTSNVATSNLATSTLATSTLACSTLACSSLACSSWYGFDAGPVRGLVLDTVNPEGGWEGSIDAAQLAWLEGELEAGSSRWIDRDGRACRRDRPDRLFVLFSHHPLRALVNAWSPAGRHRATGAEVEAVLGRFPNLVAWVNGHTHTNTVTPHRSHPSAGGGWWEVTTASHVDWPQQSRIIELAEDVDNGGLVIACTVLDHGGLIDPRGGDLDEVTTLAGWSRELAANDWQHPATGTDSTGPGRLDGRGHRGDRNVLLVSPVAACGAGVGR
jgi:metallophosphoesterase (TIGR03767 family)